tara:strand:+ start:9583 stop:9900 length:318 start_codon:yes stop_codon:yes gene_type:complete
MEEQGKLFDFLVDSVKDEILQIFKFIKKRNFRFELITGSVNNIASINYQDHLSSRNTEKSDLIRDLEMDLQEYFEIPISLNLIEDDYFDPCFSKKLFKFAITINL